MEDGGAGAGGPGPSGAGAGAAGGPAGALAYTAYVGTANLGRAAPDARALEALLRPALGRDVVVVGAQEGRYPVPAADPLWARAWLDRRWLEARGGGGRAQRAFRAAARARRWLPAAAACAACAAAAGLGWAALPRGRQAAWAALGGLAYKAAAAAAGEWLARAHWVLLVHACLGGPEAYRLVGCGTLLEMRQAVFVRAGLEGRAELATAAVPAGYLGVVGNKGAVVSRLRLGGATLVFVSAHLAHSEFPVEQRLAKRRAQARKILGRVRALAEPGGGDPPPREPAVVFSGDLNFRVQSDRFPGGRDTVRDLVAEGAFGEVLENEQLVLDMRKGRAFSGFSEPEIAFAPTYKLARGPRPKGGDRPYERNRTPSWCDRVLFKGNLVQGEYGSVPLPSSDHDAVWATFETKV